MIEHYILLLLAFCTFLFAVDKNQYKIGTVFSSVIFFVIAYILVTFRASSVGSDTIPYIEYFRDSWAYDSYTDFMDYGRGRFEVGYATLSYLISRLTDDYTVFFGICNFIYFIATILFFRFNCHNKYAWILPWFVLGMYYDLFNTLRASMAMLFVYLTAIAFLRGSRGRSILYYALAASMHVSAIPTAVMFFLKSKYVNKLLSHEIVLLIMFGLLGAFFSQFMSLLPDYYSNYYFESEYGQGAVRIASISDMVMLVSLYLLSYRKSLTEWKDHDFFKIMFLFAMGMSFLGLFLPSMNRVEFFFKPFALVYVLNTFRHHQLWRKLSIILVFIALAIYQIVAFIIRPEWLNIFPYSFR
jgi:hypothetical protein